MSNNYNLKEFSSTAVITENGTYYPSTISISTINTKCKENELKNNDYDPFQSRELEHPNSDVRSFANLLKSSLGSGILAMPSAFKNAGTIVGIFGTIILGYICTHCVYLLVKTQQDVCRLTKVPSLGYAETVESVFATGPEKLRKLSRASRSFYDTAADDAVTASLVRIEYLDSDTEINGCFACRGSDARANAWSIEAAACNECVIDARMLRTNCHPSNRYQKYKKIFIDWAMAFTILGACSVYVILLVDSVDQIVDFYAGDDYIQEVWYFLIFLIPILFFTQIKNLKYLAPFSGFANILLILTFVICLYYICSNLEGFSQRPQAVSIEKLPLFVSTVIFAMEGIGVVLPVENTMANPHHFLGCPGVLNLTMTSVVLLYMTMGVLGYVRYGDKAKGSITLNLPSDEIAALMAKCFIVLAIFFTYTLQFYVPMEIVWRNTKHRVAQKYHNYAQAVIRAVFATLTVVAAALFPHLENVIGLEGAFFYSFLGLVAPASLHLIYSWDRDLGKYNWILYKDILLIFFGMFVLVAGVTQSIREIIK